MNRRGSYLGGALCLAGGVPEPGLDFGQIILIVIGKKKTHYEINEG